MSRQQNVFIAVALVKDSGYRATYLFNSTVLNYQKMFILCFHCFNMHPCGVNLIPLYPENAVGKRSKNSLQMIYVCKID